MTRTGRLLMVSLSLCAGCSKGIEGFWIGRLDCEGFPYDFEMDLARSEGLTFEGTGEQARQFTSVEGVVTDVIIGFDASLTQSKAGGQQVLDGGFTCTSEQTLETPPAGGSPTVVGEGCEPLRFREYQIEWDGEDTIDIVGPDGCSGDLERR